MRRLDTLLALLAVGIIFTLGAGLAVSAPVRPPPERTIPTPPPRPTEQLLTEGTIGPVTVLDPQFAVTPAERSISALMFRGLTRLGPDGEILPDLASDWEVDAAGLVWTFHIRPAERWHDGRLISADDVITTVETLTDPRYDGPAAGGWSGVTAERVDRFTVRLHLPGAISTFLPQTTAPLVPAHLLGGVSVEDRPTSTFARRPVGNGPFAIETVRARFVVLRRVGPPPGGPSPTYGLDPVTGAPESTPRAAPDPRPLLERYRLRLYDDAAALVEALRSGEVQMAAGLEPADLGPIARERDIDALRYPGTQALMLVPNLRSSTAPLFDAAVRRALSLAVDRGRIGAEVFSGAATPATTLFSPASPLYDAAASGEPRFDPDAAHAGLVAAGWTETSDGWRMPGSDEAVLIELVVRDAPDSVEDVLLAEQIAEDWRELGLQVDVLPVPPDELIDQRLRAGLFDVALLDVELGLDPDLYPLFVSGEAVVGGSNIGGYQSSLMDRLLAEARQVADPATRAERARALQAALSREMPVIPIAFPDHLVLLREEVAGPVPRPVRVAEGRYWDVLTWRLALRPDE